MQGYDNEEVTHAAVATLIAGHQADVGFGVQAAAAHYGLGFVPVCHERYHLACAPATLESPAFAELLRALRGAQFAARVAQLPGYSAPEAGRVMAPADAHTLALATP
jgi:molybdate-binding protein